MSSLNSVETLHGFFGGTRRATTENLPFTHGVLAFESIVPFKEEESEPDHNVHEFTLSTISTCLLTRLSRHSSAARSSDSSYGGATLAT
jgi:hypothetical protein